ncbi:hypothetical protein PCASD_23872 [Puccinia coronata f. sp. avenae]|uniref:Uncharacterized protein n=1 Tax=Puccinia coronata f. sp. avenae TaxID=200324 RepID=A0A2N5SKQ4_9BASI|nr:hypothetical protein PCASD_23872 [Puccinia coronata f. sp. avenae]
MFAFAFATWTESRLCGTTAAQPREPTSAARFSAFRTNCACGPGVPLSRPFLPLRRPDGSITSDKREQATLLFTGTSCINAPIDLLDIPPKQDTRFEGPGHRWDCKQDVEDKFSNPSPLPDQGLQSIH